MLVYQRVIKFRLVEFPTLSWWFCCEHSMLVKSLITSGCLWSNQNYWHLRIHDQNPCSNTSACVLLKNNNTYFVCYILFFLLRTRTKNMILDQIHFSWGKNMMFLVTRLDETPNAQWLPHISATATAAAAAARPWMEIHTGLFQCG